MVLLMMMILAFWWHCWFSVEKVKNRCGCW